MAFRKRNVGVPGRNNSKETDKSDPKASTLQDAPKMVRFHGVRRSPIDGRSVTSTGTPSLDSLFAGHSGLPLGCSMLIEEAATTDYAGTLLRYFAAEGILQQHRVHAIGLDPSWGKDLPGVVGSADFTNEGKASTAKEQERMKIAWRYQNLGEFGAESSRVPNRRGNPSTATNDPNTSTQEPFCHSYDLTKRLPLPSPTAVNYIPTYAGSGSSSPFTSIMDSLQKELAADPNSMHRVIISSLVSPATYPPEACMPNNVLQFVHALQNLLKEHADRLCVMLSLSLALYPRMHGMVRWMELLFDGVIELVPFPHNIDFGSETSSAAVGTVHEDKPLGMVKIYRLPIVHERGSGTSNAGVGTDLAFTVTRKRFQIKPYSLPPVDGDTEAQQGHPDSNKASLDF